jgi:hypothetical protein
MGQLTARSERMQAAFRRRAGENLLGQPPEAAKMTIRFTHFANDLHAHE